MLQILTDKNLHVIGDPTNNVYALGDCADIRDNPLPCIAQVTSKQGGLFTQAHIEYTSE